MQWAGVPALLPSRAQAVRNIVRAVFTGVIVFFDYMLMLIVMSFNLGIIASAVGGFALGTFLFGHVAERDSSTMALSAGGDEAFPGLESDLEVRFIEPQCCCDSQRL